MFKLLNPQKEYTVQNQQYSERLILIDTVPAGESKLGKVNVSHLGHFLCKFMTGSYETLALVEEAPADTGVNYLRGLLKDGSNQRQLFNDYIPLDLFLSPGRTKSVNSPTAIVDAPGNNLFYPITFEYLFSINSDILLDVKNDSDVDLEYRIMFHGLRLLPRADRNIR